MDLIVQKALEGKDIFRGGDNGNSKTILSKHHNGKNIFVETNHGAETIIVRGTIDQFVTLSNYYMTKNRSFLDRWITYCKKLFYQKCMYHASKIDFVIKNGLSESDPETFLNQRISDEVYSGYIIRILFKCGARPLFLHLNALIGPLATDGLLNFMLKHGLDPNTPLKFGPMQERLCGRDRHNLFVCLTLLRKYGTRFPPDIMVVVAHHGYEKIIRSFLQWGYDPNPFILPSIRLRDKETYTSYGRFVDTVPRLPWSPSSHLQVTTLPHTSVVMTILLLWSTQGGNQIHLLPIELIHYLLSEVYQDTHPLLL